MSEQARTSAAMSTAFSRVWSNKLSIPVWSHQVRHGAVLDMGDDERPVLTSDSLNRYTPSLPSSLDSASLHSRHSCILTMNKMSLAMTQLDRLLVYMEMQTDLWLDQLMLSVHTSTI